MTDNKDFLSQFSNENKKPESFKEETLTKIQKEKKPINKGLLVGLIIVFLLTVCGVYYFVFAPKIVMPDFVGQNKNDVAAWVKQQGIETSGIIFNEEYDFSSDANTIIGQDVEAGVKVDEKVKITFTLSLGADPNELILVPDLKNMDKAEIKQWIDENKLTKTKITTTYSEEVENDQVINFVFTGCDSDSFKRNSTLKITISKGPQPADEISVEDFVGKSEIEAKTWASSKKIEFKATEAFSQTVDDGLIISQSLSKGKTIKAGDTFSVVVSKGKGVTVPDFNKMTNKEVDKWLLDNGIVATYKYSSSSNYVLSCSLSANSIVSNSELAKMELVINRGSSFYLSDFLNGQTIVGSMTLQQLNDLCNANRDSGIDAYAYNWSNSTEVYSYDYGKGIIVSVKYFSNSTGKEYMANEKMPLDLRFEVVVSKGKITNVDISGAFVEEGYYDGNKLVDILSSNNIPFYNKLTNVEKCQLYVDNTLIDTNSFDYYEGQSVEIK